jgi:hypothetical protein
MTTKDALEKIESRKQQKPPEEDWEKEFDKEIGIIEGYKLCITYEDQQDQDVEYEVKSFIRQLLAKAKEEERKKTIEALKEILIYGEDNLTVTTNHIKRIIKNLEGKPSDSEGKKD